MTAPAAEKSVWHITNLAEKNVRLSEREKKLRRSVNFRPIHLSHVLAHIQNQDIDPELQAALIKQARGYPTQALQYFAQNFDQIVSAAQRKLRKNYVVPDAADLTAVVAVAQPKVEPKVESKTIIKAKKIDISEILVKQSSDPLPSPLESIAVPAEVVKPVAETVKPTPRPRLKPKEPVQAAVKETQETAMPVIENGNAVKLTAKQAAAMFADRFNNMEFE